MMRRGNYRPLRDEDVQEIYAPEEAAKTVAHIGGPYRNEEPEGRS